MNIIKKDAAITNTGPDDAFPGSFEVILSAPTKDRDGDTLLPEDWKQPLPDHITFDTDHGMSVATTVGSGKPELLDDGRLKVNGTYSSLPRAQEARTLVKEGHIRTTSVAFMSTRGEDTKGVTRTVRELLNGAFVAIPSNREALVLSSKSIEAKAGARNSATDAAHVQAIHDHALALGADPKGAPKDDPKPGDKPAPKPFPPKKSFTLKDADTDSDSDPVALISATDAAIDQAIDLLASVDQTILPDEVVQAIALIQAADSAVDELMDVLGIRDPDEDGAASGADPAPAAGTPVAPAAGAKSAPDVDADSDAVLAYQARMKSIEQGIAAFSI